MFGDRRRAGGDAYFVSCGRLRLSFEDIETEPRHYLLNMQYTYPAFLYYLLGFYFIFHEDVNVL